MSLLAINQFGLIAHGESANTNLFINPAMYIAQEVGEIFDMAISVSDVENLHSAQFTVTYNTSLLDVVHVALGSFFPSPPRSNFQYEISESLGFVKVNMTLADSEPPKSGNGTLASISFKVVQDGESCSSSPLNLEETLLLDAALSPIIHDSVGAVYFWKSMQPDPPEEGRLIDLYTQKGGVGQNVPDGEFTCGEDVRLIALVTYSGWPVQKKLVSFEVRNPLDETVFVRVVMTDINGLAEVIFRIPRLSSSNGTWKAIAVVEVAGEVVWDTLTFKVTCLIPVGGYTITIKEITEKSTILYLTLVVVLAAVFTVIKRKKHSSLNQ